MICKHCGMLTKPFDGGACEFCNKYVAGFPCSDCGKVCKAQSGLTRHVTTQHLRQPLEMEYSANAQLIISRLRENKL